MLKAERAKRRGLNKANTLWGTTVSSQGQMLLDCTSKMAHRPRIFHFIHKLRADHDEIQEGRKKFGLVFMQILKYQIVVADKLCHQPWISAFSSYKTKAFLMPIPVHVRALQLLPKNEQLH